MSDSQNSREQPCSGGEGVHGRLVKQEGNGGVDGGLLEDQLNWIIEDLSVQGFSEEE